MYTPCTCWPASQLLYATGTHETYADSLFESAMATITGSGLTPTSAFSRILQVLLAVYSVAVFATLAGSLGAFFLREERPGTAGATPDTADTPRDIAGTPPDTADTLRDRITGDDGGR